MMLAKRKVNTLTAAVLVVAGCASSDYRLARENGMDRRSASAQATDEPPPKILPETHYRAARMCEQQGAIDKAIAHYRKAIAVNHSYVDAYHRLGLMLSISGKHDEAAQAIAKAVELRPDNAILRNNLGFELLYLERWSDAEREFKEAVRIDPRLTRAHINLALVLGRIGRFDESLASFKVVLPEPDAYYNLGLLLRAQKHYAEAAEAFEHVLKLNPDFTAAARQLEQLMDRPELKAKTQLAETTSTATDTGTIRLAPLENAPTGGSPTPGGTTPPAMTNTTPGGSTPAATNTAVRPGDDPAQDLLDLINGIFPPGTDPTAKRMTGPVETATAKVTPIMPMADSPAPATTATSVTRTTPAATQTKTEPTPTSATDSVQSEPTHRGATTGMRTEVAPTREWVQTLTDIAQVLQVVDNERNCFEEAQAAARPAPEQPESDKAVLEVVAVSGAVQPAAPMGPAEAVNEAKQADNLALGPVTEEAIIVRETTTPDGAREVVAVLPAVEIRGDTDEIAGKEDEPTVTAEQFFPWQDLRELESTLQVIRNEVECRKAVAREGADLFITEDDDIPEHTFPAYMKTTHERTIDMAPRPLPPAAEPADDGRRGNDPPCDDETPKDRAFNFDGSYGELEALLLIAWNDDDCVREQVVAEARLLVPATDEPAVMGPPVANAQLMMINAALLPEACDRASADETPNAVCAAANRPLAIPVR